HCPRLLKPDEPWKTPRIASRWTYTASLLSSTPAGAQFATARARRPIKHTAGSMTSVSEDHADEPNTTNRICSFTSIREHSSLSQLFSICFRRRVAIIRYFSENRDRDV